jgi:Domain of unknown function (DUF397)
MHTPKWQKSSFSGMEPDNNCLELAAFPHGPALRESDDPAVVLATTPARLAALLRAAVRSQLGDGPGPS